MSIILCVIIAAICFTVGIFLGILAATAKRVGYMEITDTDTKTNYNLIVTVPIDDLGKYKVVAFIVKHKDESEIELMRKYDEQVRERNKNISFNRKR